MNARNPWLVAGGVLSLIAAALHVLIFFGGAEWYRFFGAGEEMALMSERGEWAPTVITMGIATVLTIWAAYAFAGAGLIRRLPLMRVALVIISGIYLLRGLMLFPIWVARPDLVNDFEIWSSLIVLVYGIAYAVGTLKAWPNMSLKEAH